MSPRLPEEHAETCFSLGCLNFLEHGSGNDFEIRSQIASSQLTLGRTERGLRCASGRHRTRRTGNASIARRAYRRVVHSFEITYWRGSIHYSNAAIPASNLSRRWLPP